MKKIIAAALLCGASLAQAAPTAPAHRCSAEAVKQATSLLTFHFGPDERMEIDTDVKVLAPIRNPANKKQSFDVLEVWGTIYKGQYRMHLIYAQLGGSCVLMGQEILEHASL
ncbi:hypothetical protein [Rugamonas sp. DEMB1]|nr:hypothetical protein [Rugamonas sp. DEMB1]WGG53265.1 hypothetical protein QC826_14815 [Rugamonas sp. DEMB1]